MYSLCDYDIQTFPFHAGDKEFMICAETPCVIYGRKLTGPFVILCKFICFLDYSLQKPAHFVYCLPDTTSRNEQKQNQAVMEMAMNAQMLSALGGYMPGLDPAYLPYMYSGVHGYFPGMGLPLVQPGILPGWLQCCLFICLGICVR